MKVVKVKKANIENVKFLEPKINPKYKNVSVPISYSTDGGKNPFVLQIPSMKAFVGISCFDQDGQSPKYSLPLSLSNLDTDPNHKKMLDFFKDFDEFVVNMVHKNPSWIKKNKSTKREVIEAFYTPCLRFPKDKDTGEITDKYPPNIKVKLMQSRDGNFMTKVFNKDRQALTNVLESIPKGSMVTTLMECTGLWVVNGKFGVSWRAVQIKVDSVPQRDAYSFEEDSDQESNNEDSDFEDSDSD